MRLISFALNRSEKYGVVKGDAIVDASEKLGGQYATLKEVIHADAVADIADVVAGQEGTIPLADIEFRLPIAPTGKVFCVARNYAAVQVILGLSLWEPRHRRRILAPPDEPAANSRRGHNLATLTNPAWLAESDLFISNGRLHGVGQGRIELPTP